MAPRRDAAAPSASAGEGGPSPSLSALDGAVLLVGIVLGVGIFRSPSVVAANAGDGTTFLALWLVGGGISLVGALCYAELATAHPDAGGEYHFISRAYGSSLGFLVAWSRMTVIQTGSIAILSFVIGDYTADLLALGEGAPALVAGGVVVLLTAVNLAGLRHGRWAQYVLTGGAVAALAIVVAAGFLQPPPAAPSPPPAGAGAAGGSLGRALIFVLLAFGGWSEGAYVSAEISGGRRSIGRMLLWGTGAITLLYVLANAAYLYGLGMEGVAGSDAVAADLLGAAAGPWGRRVVSGAVILAAFSSTNATMITGARSNYALGRDWPLFRFLGGWKDERNTPAAALLLQGAVALALVAFGAAQRSGFEAMVDYTAPVYWLTLLATGAAVVVLRRREPGTDRPYRVPLYPLTPILFCAAAAGLVYSSVEYAGSGALVGLAVVAAGLPFLLAAGPGTSNAGAEDGPPGPNAGRDDDPTD